MIKLQDLLEMTEVVSEESSVGDTPNLDDLEKTASYLQHLSSPDRLPDTAAKQAVVEDMLKEAGYMWDAITGKFIHSRAARAAGKRLQGAEKAVVAAKKNKKAEDLLTKAEDIKNGRSSMTDIGKLLTYGAVGTAGAAGGYMYANKNKDEQLKEIAKKYYQAGKAGN